MVAIPFVEHLSLFKLFSKIDVCSRQNDAVQFWLFAADLSRVKIRRYLISLLMASDLFAKSFTL